jgi:D-proline reductase (dithiol) PrdB
MSEKIAVRLQGGFDEADLATRYADWLERIERMHANARALANPLPAFTRLEIPLAQARVGLVTSAGAYVEGDEPFDVASAQGDPTIRLIPGDVELARVRFAHSHYDTTRAERDPNVVLPLEPLRALARDGVIGSVSTVHVGMMGFNPDPRRIRDESAPAVADLFGRAKVDVVLLSPG